MKFSPDFHLTFSVNNGSSRRGIIRDITAEEIEEIFGFASNFIITVVDDDPYKVVHSWAVDVSEVPGMFTDDTWTVHVWDYKGSHKFGQFSVCGEPFILEMIFGDRYVRER